MISLIEQEESRLKKANKAAEFHAKVLGSGVGMLGVGALIHKAAKKVNPEWVKKQRSGRGDGNAAKAINKSIKARLTGEDI